METIINNVWSIIQTGLIGVVSFFLKRTIDKQDKCATKEELAEAKKEMLTVKSEVKEMLSEFKAEIKDFDDKYARKSELADIKVSMDKLNTTVDELRENSVKNNDFLRMFTRLETKVDELMRREHERH